MPPPLVVLDTNVLVAAIRSRLGASFAVLDLVGEGRFEIAVSVPLVLEYEDAMVRRRGLFAIQDIRAIIDYVCSVAKQQEIFYLWRPLLSDPKDDMVAELAVASGADAIVTHNLRDFGEVARFGIKVFPPRILLQTIGALR